MSQLDETLVNPPSSEKLSRLIPIGEPQASAPGPSIEKRSSCLDNIFNFQIVVFEVENTLFQVLRNGFNVPGTPFEAMFAVPPMDSIEGSSLEYPIHLPGVKVAHFRSFLRVLFPFIDPRPVVEFDEWVGVLNLATKWLFQEIRARAISKLSELIRQKTAMERIALARKYRVAEWLRNAFLELAQKTPLDFEELRPAEPSFNAVERNWEADVKKWKATIREWETLARILYIQTRAANSMSKLCGDYHCSKCDMDFGGLSSNGYLCKCRLLYLVDDAFRGELESLRGEPELVELEVPLSPNITHSAALPKRKRRKITARSSDENPWALMSDISEKWESQNPELVECPLPSYSAALPKIRSRMRARHGA